MGERTVGLESLCGDVSGYLTCLSDDVQLIAFVAVRVFLLRLSLCNQEHSAPRAESTTATDGLRHPGNPSPRAHQAKTSPAAPSHQNNWNRVPKTYPRQAAHRLARKAKHIRRGRVGRDRHRTRASVSTRWSVRDSEAYKG